MDQAIQELMLTPPVAMQLLPRPSRAVPERVIDQDLPRVHPKGPRQVQGPWQGSASAQFPGLKGRNLQGELLCWNYNMERPCQKKPCQLKHEVLWVSPLYLVHSPVTRAQAGQFR